MAMKLRVISTEISTGTVEVDKVIDHDNREDRVWLGKHCFWAFRNGRMISTIPV